MDLMRAIAFEGVERATGALCECRPDDSKTGTLLLGEKARDEDDENFASRGTTGAGEGERDGEPQGRRTEYEGR